MPRVTPVLRRACKSIQDLDLLKVLQSEINHELSSNRFQDFLSLVELPEKGSLDYYAAMAHSDHLIKARRLVVNFRRLQSDFSTPHFRIFDESGSSGDFVLDWDSPQSQDVVLRKKCASGEEVAVSALLGGETFQGDDRFPREALLKICVNKPGLNSLLQFDCIASGKGGNAYKFDIQIANYIQSPSRMDSSVYKGPSFSCLDPDLQHELKQYLAARGIGEDFINFLLLHLHRKEQGQYVNWLHKLKDMMGDHE